MPFLFHQISDGTWESVEITRAICVNINDGEVRYAGGTSGGGVDALALVPHRDGVHTYYSLITTHAARVNGRAMHSSIRVLNDRDEISILNHRFCFSGQLFATVAAFEPEKPNKRYGCPVCDEAVVRGDPGVVCPGCGIVYHEGCWHYLEGLCSTLGCPHTTRDRELWQPDPEPRPTHRPAHASLHRQAQEV